MSQSREEMRAAILHSARTVSESKRMRDAMPDSDDSPLKQQINKLIAAGETKLMALKDAFDYQGMGLYREDLEIIQKALELRATRLEIRVGENESDENVARLEATYEVLTKIKFELIMR